MCALAERAQRASPVSAGLRLRVGPGDTVLFLVSFKNVTLSPTPAHPPRKVFFSPNIYFRLWEMNTPAKSLDIADGIQVHLVRFLGCPMGVWHAMKWDRVHGYFLCLGRAGAACLRCDWPGQVPPSSPDKACVGLMGLG